MKNYIHRALSAMIPALLILSLAIPSSVFTKSVQAQPTVPYQNANQHSGNPVTTSKPSINIFKRKTWQYGGAADALQGSLQDFPENYQKQQDDKIEYYYHFNSNKNELNSLDDLNSMLPDSYNIGATISGPTHDDIVLDPISVTITKKDIGIKSLKADDRAYDGTKNVLNPVVEFLGVPNGKNINDYSVDNVTLGDLHGVEFVGNKQFSADIKLNGDDAKKYYFLSTNPSSSIFIQDGSFKIYSADLEAKLKDNQDSNPQNTTFKVKSGTEVTKKMILDRISLTSIQGVDFYNDTDRIVFKVGDNSADFSPELTVDTSSTNTIKAIVVKFLPIDLNDDQKPEYNSNDITLYLSVNEKAHISTALNLDSIKLDKIYDGSPSSPSGKPSVLVQDIDESKINLAYYNETETEKLNSAPAKVGKYVAVYTFDGYDGSLKINFEITKADPTKVFDGKEFKARSSTKLSAITLPIGWKWENPDTELKFNGAATQESHKAILEIEDIEKSNYTTTEHMVTIKKYVYSSSSSSSSSESSNNSSSTNTNKTNQSANHTENTSNSSAQGGIANTSQSNIQAQTLFPNAIQRSNNESISETSTTNQAENSDQPLIGEQSSYEITHGKNQAFNDAKSVSFRIDAPMEDFVNLFIDNRLVEKSNYTIESGSTIITLSENFAQTLANGDHEFKAEYKNGRSVVTKFSIAKHSNKNWLWWVAAGFIVIAIGAISTYRRQRNA